MRDIYIYEDCNVLKNLLHIKDKALLDDAEADYVTYRLKEIVKNPLPGLYDYKHLLEVHKYIFQDIYEWAGQARKLNIYKEEPVLGGISIDYSDMLSISKDAEDILWVMREKSWNDMNKHEAAENNAQYVRTSLVAYNNFMLIFTINSAGNILV